VIYIYVVISFFRNFFLLKNHEFDSKEDIESYQFRKMKALIFHAWENNVFYRRLWSSVGFSPSDFKSLADMKKLPIIGKEDIVNNYKDILSSNKYMSSCRTSGTSGVPLNFFLNKKLARAKELVFLLNQYKRIGYRPWHRSVILRGDVVSEKKLAENVFWRFFIGRNALSFPVFHLTEFTIDIYLKRMRRFNPSYINAYPSALVLLCNLMKVRGDLPFKNLKGVICSSETVFDWQRKLAREVLGVEIFSDYGHSEKAVLASECEDSRKMHFSPFYGYTEFVNSNGDDCSIEGEKGVVITTGFDQDNFPFIRYRTDDVVEYSKQDCTCGRNYLIANKIVGRKFDIVIDNKKERHVFLEFDDVFIEFKEKIKAYQYIQNNFGVLDLKIELYSSLGRKDLIRINNSLLKVFPFFEVKLSIVDSIKRTEAGKFRYFIQNIEEEIYAA